MASAASVFQRVQLVDLNGHPLAEERDDDGEADGDFGGGDSQDEEDENVSVHRAVETRERDEPQGRRDEHQLEAHEDDEGVTANEHAEQSNREEQHADRDVSIES